MKLLYSLCALVFLVLANSVFAQTWPSRPITIVVPFAPGGNIDIVGRTVGRELALILKQPVIIENKPGAGGMVGAAYVAKSKPDGYTFLVSSNGLVTTSLIRNDQPYKDQDLVPVSLLTIAPSVYVTNATNPASNIKEFVDNLKAKGINRILFATAGRGTTPDFVGGLLQQATGIQMESVAYKSGSETITAVVGGQIELAAESTQVVIPRIKAGLIKALAVTYEQRSTALPDSTGCVQ